MFASIFLFAAALSSANALTCGGAKTLPSVTRTAVLRMFEGEKKEPLTIEAITRSAEAGAVRKGSLIVTDTGSLYASRKLFPMINDFGRYKSIIVHGDEVAAMKKALLTRQARYSGLLDVLQFSDGAFATAMEGADAWLALNVDESSFPEQLAAA